MFTKALCLLPSTYSFQFLSPNMIPVVLLPAGVVGGRPLHVGLPRRADDGVGHHVEDAALLGVGERVLAVRQTPPLVVVGLPQSVQGVEVGLFRDPHRRISQRGVFEVVVGVTERNMDRYI